MQKPFIDFLLENDHHLNQFPDYEMMGNCISAETFIKLIKEFQGLTFYIPKPCYFTDAIFEFYNQNKDKGIKFCAYQCGISEAGMRNFINKYNKNEIPRRKRK